MADDFGAFVKGHAVEIVRKDTGPLSGCDFAAKDVFDIAGLPTSNGQPLWPKTRPLPENHATAIEKLLDAGAKLIGKTVCDEMCYSLAGDNIHYGAPVNPTSPERSVGGSSSGSAAAVAGKLVDFALGTDCGGSVRCPASFTGTYGIRPTHGRVDDAGVAPLAGSFDVVGWFSREPKLLAKIGAVLLEGEQRCVNPRKALFATDAFSRLSKEEQTAAEKAAGLLADKLNLSIQTVILSDEGLDRWFAAFRHLQALEIWQNHSSWIEEHQPTFGPGVKERFEYASTLTQEDYQKYKPIREQATARITDILDVDGEGSILILPTAPPSPRRDAGDAEIEKFRQTTMGLTCPAGLSGCPQISLPIAATNAPIGISILGPQYSDEGLLELAIQAA